MRVRILLIFILLGSVTGSRLQESKCLNQRCKRETGFLRKLIHKPVEWGRSIKNKVLNFGSELSVVEDLKTKFNNYFEEANNTNETLYQVITKSEDEDNDCDDDATVNSMTTPQLTALHGYVSESHTILTEDGYLLTVHRIPYSKNSQSRVSPNKTVLLHHGVLGSSADWVLAGPGRGLSYMLSDSGYDVWMANVRGNRYSRAHKSNNTKTKEFWDFSFHEVGQYDLPAVIDYIVERKGVRNVDYVGFSMGTSALFALLSTKPQYNEILRTGVALAPIAYMKNVKGPLKLLSKFNYGINGLLRLFGANEFMPRNLILDYLRKHSCKVDRVQEVICEASMYFLCAHDKSHFDRSLHAIIYGHISGASTKTLVHYSQIIKAGGVFQEYDYGREANLHLYKSVNPPEYSVHGITLPIALFSAKDDWFSPVTDGETLFGKLSNPIGHYIIPDNDFNHLDFVFAKDAPDIVYNKVLDVLQNGYSDAYNNIVL